MHKFVIEKKLEKLLGKLKKKDVVLYASVMSKFKQILDCEDMNHYKNLRAPLQEYKRVHVLGSFVLLFKYEEDVVVFFDVDHHDTIYL